MSFDPDGQAQERQLSTEDLLEKILKELQKMNVHLQQITEQEVTEEEIEE